MHLNLATLHLLCGTELLPILKTSWRLLTPTASYLISAGIEMSKHPLVVQSCLDTLLSLNRFFPHCSHYKLQVMLNKANCKKQKSTLAECKVQTKGESRALCSQQRGSCWMSTTEWQQSEYVYFSTPVSRPQKIAGLPLSEDDEQIRVCQGVEIYESKDLECVVISTSPDGDWKWEVDRWNSREQWWHFNSGKYRRKQRLI